MTDLPDHGRERDRRVFGLRDAATALITASEWSAVLELRAWAWEHRLFNTPGAPLRGFLRRWEEALLSGAPLAEAARLVRDEVATAVLDPWERLAARATWAELRPLLADDRAAWSVAEARVLRGETLDGRIPHSGLPLRRFRWEPQPELPTFSVMGCSWGSRGFRSTLAPVTLPPPVERLAHEPEWEHLLSAWGAWGTSVVKVAGTGLQALATLLGEQREADKWHPQVALTVGRCTWKEALGAMMRMHGDPAPYTEGRGMVEARRAVWRVLAASAGLAWPVGGSRLQAAMKGWRWSRYDPQEPYAEADHWSLFVVLEDPRRGLAWATYAWVTD